jgi:hypothetical protein
MLVSVDIYEFHSRREVGQNNRSPKERSKRTLVGFGLQSSLLHFFFSQRDWDCHDRYKDISTFIPATGGHVCRFGTGEFTQRSAVRRLQYRSYLTPVPGALFSVHRTLPNHWTAVFQAFEHLERSHVRDNRSYIIAVSLDRNAPDRCLLVQFW